MEFARHPFARDYGDRRIRFRREDLAEAVTLGELISIRS
jgi:hypothetical protein